MSLELAELGMPYNSAAVESLSICYMPSFSLGVFCTLDLSSGGREKRSKMRTKSWL
jgi:hypothetical protein